MSTADRVRLITPDGRISVHDYAFSQVCRLISGLSESDKDVFWAGKESVITAKDTEYAVAGTSLKYVGPM